MNAADQFEPIRHTPGPWEAINNYVRSPMVQPAGSGRPTGMILAECRDGFGGSVNSQEASDNAKLIAAAPELLAALNEARNGLRWYQETYPEVCNGCDDEAMERIDAAISKATGAPT